MKNNEVAISANNVSKVFKLPHEKSGSIKSAAVNFWKREKGYELQEALKNVSFEVKKGEFFGIVGRNGSGKSTLLKLLAGIYAPTEGKIHIDGKLTPFIELGVGFNPELTGRENVFLNGSLLGFNRKDMEAMYQDIVDFAELERFMDQKLKNYSSGMQVRLAFSIAIRAKSDILLIDEVLAVGDASFQRKCFKIFKDMKKSGQTVILVTHDMGAVQEYCDRAMMIQDSKVLMIGKPREIALRYDVANAETVASNNKNKSASTDETLARPNQPDVKIESLRLVSGDNGVFLMKEDIVFEVELRVNRPVEIQLNLYILKRDGTYLAGMNSTNDIKKFVPTKGNHVLRCKLDAAQLTSGEYRSGVGVYTYPEPAKFIDVADPSYGATTPTITITDKSTYQDGNFLMKGHWSKE